MTTMQMKLELILVPVTDVDRTKAFYDEALTSVRSMYRIGALLPILGILMAIAGPCSNSSAALSFK